MTESFFNPILRIQLDVDLEAAQLKSAEVPPL